jgi:hypothetical protein
LVGIATVETAFERGWSTLRNGELIADAEQSFDVCRTTDKHLRYQQNRASAFSGYFTSTNVT